ncbi:MAG: hypothetical protein AAGC57_00425 [Pseudomonadota bacterium]
MDWFELTKSTVIFGREGRRRVRVGPVFNADLGDVSDTNTALVGTSGTIATAVQLPAAVWLLLMGKKDLGAQRFSRRG